MPLLKPINELKLCTWLPDNPEQTAGVLCGLWGEPQHCFEMQPCGSVSALTALLSERRFGRPHLLGGFPSVCNTHCDAARGGWGVKCAISQNGFLRAPISPAAEAIPSQRGPSGCEARWEPQRSSSGVEAARAVLEGGVSGSSRAARVPSGQAALQSGEPCGRAEGEPRDLRAALCSEQPLLRVLPFPAALLEMLLTVLVALYARLLCI